MTGVRFVQKSKPSESHVVDFVETNLNLLAHAQAIELSIGSRCGGHGICGGDRIRISNVKDRATLSPVTEKEREHLSVREIESGFRLACQCYPNSSDQTLEVEMEPDGLSPRFT